MKRLHQRIATKNIKENYYPKTIYPSLSLSLLFSIYREFDVSNMSQTIHLNRTTWVWILNHTKIVSISVDLSVRFEIARSNSHVDRLIFAWLDVLCHTIDLRSIGCKVNRSTCAFKTCPLFSWHEPLQLIFSGLILMI